MIAFHTGYDSGKESSKAVRKWLIIPALFTTLAMQEFLVQLRDASLASSL